MRALQLMETSQLRCALHSNRAPAADRGTNPLVLTLTTLLQDSRYRDWHDRLPLQLRSAGSAITFGVNVKGTLFTVQKALPLLPDGSSIILDASANSVTGTPGLSVYSATKAAIRSFARSWILDLQSRHIRINVVSPGPVNTPGLNEFIQENGEVKATIADSVPLGRLGTPDDIAKAVSFLASDESSYINGIELFIDGGQTQI